MKMKISKASWMILAVGAFIIILAGLGLARSGQTKEYEKLNNDLVSVEIRAGNIQTAEFQTQVNELKAQLQDSQDRVEEAKDRLKQTIISVDVADKFYEIAAFYNVTVATIGTTNIAEQSYEKIGCEMIAVSASVVGQESDIVDFIIGLNNNYATGYVRAAQLSIGGEDELFSTTANIQMTVYSYKGN